MLALDTCTVILAINQRQPAVRRHLERALAEGTPIGIPSIVLYELWYGVHKSARPEANAQALSLFLALDVTPWSFDHNDAEAAGDIRANLERAGTPIGPYDLLIAAQARCRDAVLVTANTREFNRVQGLRSADWTLKP